MTGPTRTLALGLRGATASAVAAAALFTLTGCSTIGGGVHAVVAHAGTAAPSSATLTPFTPTSEPPGSSAAPSTSPSASTSTGPGPQTPRATARPTPTTQRPAAPPAAAGSMVDVTGAPAGFVTPSGRFECVVEPGAAGAGAFVRCDFFNRVSFAPPPKPKNCDNDWGFTVTLGGGGPAAFSCIGDTVDGLSALGQPTAAWYRPGIDPTLEVHGNREVVLAYGRTMKSASLQCTPEPVGLTCRDTRTQAGFFLSRDRFRLTP